MRWSKASPISQNADHRQIERRPLRYGLQGLLACELIAIACESRPVPGAWTLWLSGLALLLLGVWQAIHAPAYLGRSRLAIAAFGLLMALLGPADALWRGDASLLVPPDPMFVAWTAIPTGLLLNPALLRLGTTLSAAHSTTLFSAVAIGLLGAESWLRPGGRALLCVAALTGLVLLFVGQIEVVEFRGQRGERRRGPVDEGTRRTLARVGLGVASSAMILSGLLFLGVREVATFFLPPVQASERPGLLSRRWQPLGMPDLLEAARDGSVVAYVKPLESSFGPADSGRPLYLREHVLSVYEELDGVSYLGRAPGAVKVRKDEEQGVGAGRVRLFLDDGEGSTTGRQASSVVEIEPRTRTRGARLAEPHVVWMSGRRLQEDADLAIQSLDPRARRYQVASRPELYLAEFIARGRAVRVPSHRLLPDRLADHEWLRRRAEQWMPEGQNDVDRVKQLALALRRQGEWRLLPEWPGSYRGFLEGELAGLCSHFSQTAAVLCRVLDMQARVAVGYLAQEFDPLRGLYVVRARHRHAWLEVRIEGRGWVGFEVTPGRGAGGGTADASQTPALAAGAGRAADAAGGPGAFASTSSGRASLLVALVGFAGLLFLLLLPRRSATGATDRPRAASTPATEPSRRLWRYYQLFERHCRRHGLQREPSQTAGEFILKLAGRVPALAGGLRLLRARYHACRFGEATLPREDEEQIRQLLRQLPARLRSGSHGQESESHAQS